MIGKCGTLLVINANWRDLPATIYHQSQKAICSMWKFWLDGYFLVLSLDISKAFHQGCNEPQKPSQLPPISSYFSRSNCLLRSKWLLSFRQRWCFLLRFMSDGLASAPFFRCCLPLPWGGLLRPCGLLQGKRRKKSEVVAPLRRFHSVLYAHSG